MKTENRGVERRIYAPGKSHERENRREGEEKKGREKNSGWVAERGVKRRVGYIPEASKGGTLEMGLDDHSTKRV